MADDPFKTKLERVLPVLIGLWRFRYKGNKPNWCCTWCYRGLYYDTYPKATPEAALDAVYWNWQGKKRKRRKKGPMAGKQ